MLDLDLKRCPIDERCGVIGIQQIAELCRAARRLREVARDAVAGHAQRNGADLGLVVADVPVIPLDDQLSARENSQKFFDKYNKLKRTYEALSEQTLETKREIDHLESVSAALDIALKEEDLVQIKEELMEYGYIKHRRAGDKKPKITSRPFHYITSDGFHVYVGKNNYQNDELTFKLANGGDWWFHAKGIPGSHVIVKTEGKELPDHVFEEAGALAAYYSKGRENEKVEIDYIQRKHIRKVAGAAPGFVIYHTNYSLVAEPKLLLDEVSEKKNS